MGANAIIHTEKLTKVYRIGITRRPVEAIIGLNLDVFEGEIFAYIGLNGAGKTTTIQLLLDHVRPTSGSAFIFGRDSRDYHSREKVGFLPDLPHFYRFLTATEILDYTGKLFGLSSQERSNRSRDLIDLVGLNGRANEPLRGFSRGMLQRIGLAQALINHPELVILDEPLGGLDPVGRMELRDIIVDLKRQGSTVFFSSHILDDAQRIADRVAIIHRGKLLAMGTLDELLTSKPGWEVELEPVNGFQVEEFSRDHKWEFKRLDERFLLTIPDEGGLAELFNYAHQGKLKLESVNHRRLDLEHAFLKELEKWEE